MNFYEYNDELLKQLPKGAFLTTMNGDSVNTMTIGWGDLSIVWYKEVLKVYVRYSRETYNFLENSDEFTVSFPINVDLRDELNYCGSKSFRDTDKIKDLGFTLQKSQVVSTPVIGECDLHLECKIIYKQAMEPALIPEDVKSRFYKNNDYHVVYFGEVVAKYGSL